MNPSNALPGKVRRGLSHYWPALVVGISLIMVGLYADYLNHQAIKQDLRQSVANQAGAVRARLEGNISSNAMLVKGLVAAISLEPDITQERFLALSTPLLKGYSQIRNIAAAPDLVIKYVNPREGNQAAIGLDYRQVPAQLAAVELARDSGELVLTGPVDLVQGGRGFIVRLPVFLDSDSSPDSEFWGIISSVINVDEFFMASGLKDRSFGVDLAIQALDEGMNAGRIIFGSASLFDDDPILTTVTLPYGMWQLAAIPHGGWSQSTSGVTSFRLALLLIFSLIMWPLLFLVRSQHERSKGKRHMQAVMDNSPAAIYVKDLRGRYSFVNEKFEKLFRLKREDVIGHRDSEVFTEEIASKLEERDRFVLESASATEFEEIAPKEGGLRCYLSVKFPLLDSHNSIYAVGGIATDISGHKKLELEEARRRRKVSEFNRVLADLIHENSFKAANFKGFLEPFVKKLAGVLDVAQVSVWEMDKTDSDFCLRSLQVQAISADQNGAERILQRLDFPEYFQFLNNERTFVVHDIFQDERIKKYAAELFPSNRTRAILHAPFHFSGEIAGVLCIENIDGAREWKVEEEAFVISAADILSLALEISRRGELEITLRRTEKMDALGKLTGGIAHDFNNLIGIILGYSDLLRSELPADTEVADYAKQIFHAGERGAKLTKKILGFSRKKEIEAQELNLNDLLLNQQHLLEKTLTARIQLNLQLDHSLWPIVVDAGDLEDGIINLSVNAMHAIESNGALTIETKNVQLSLLDAARLKMKPGDFVLLQVTDSGHGMERETLDRVFEPFFSTKGVEGTGLGLAQVYGFMQRSHGAIEIDSGPQVGTKVSLYFPRCEENSSTESLADNVSASVQAQGETILVVDDEPVLLSFMTQILDRQGYKVLVASDGEEALEVLATQRVDLMISDVIMPGMDGFDLAELVRLRYPNVKIQLVSGYSGKAEKGETFGEGVTALLTKPFDSSTLIERIQALLSVELGG